MSEETEGRKGGGAILEVLCTFQYNVSSFYTHKNIVRQPFTRARSYDQRCVECIFCI